MTTEARNTSRSVFSAAGVIALLLIGLAAVVGKSGTVLTAAAQNSNIQYVRFEIVSAPGKTGGTSNDQITMLFSNLSAADRVDAWKPLFGSDILQEFSFSARDAQDSTLFRFDREVRDLSFLEARFVRVVNHGSDGWAGENLSISVSPDGKNYRRILDRQSLYPRRGPSRDGGIQDYNRANWKQRSYWEAELQRVRADRQFNQTNRPAYAR